MLWRVLIFDEGTYLSLPSIDHMAFGLHADQ